MGPTWKQRQSEMDISANGVWAGGLQSLREGVGSCGRVGGWRVGGRVDGREGPDPPDPPRGPTRLTRGAPEVSLPEASEFRVRAGAVPGGNDDRGRPAGAAPGGEVSFELDRIQRELDFAHELDRS